MNIQTLRDLIHQGKFTDADNLLAWLNSQNLISVGELIAYRFAIDDAKANS